MELPKHKYRVANRPAYFRLWDRKIWSHMNYFIAQRMQLDPGNAILFLTLRFFVRKMNRLEQLAQEDWMTQLHRFIEPIPENVLANVEEGKRIPLTNDGGDVIEAVGGIVHPWAPESKMLVDEMLESWQLGRHDIDELRYNLAMAVRRVKELLCYCYTVSSIGYVGRVLAMADCEDSSTKVSGTKRQRQQVQVQNHIHLTL